MHSTSSSSLYSHGGLAAVPSEILVIMFEFLRGSELCVLAQVNKAWYEICSKSHILWKQLCQCYGWDNNNSSSSSSSRSNNNNIINEEKHTAWTAVDWKSLYMQRFPLYRKIERMVEQSRRNLLQVHSEMVRFICRQYSHHQGSVIPPPPLTSRSLQAQRCSPPASSSTHQALLPATASLNWFLEGRVLCAQWRLLPTNKTSDAGNRGCGDGASDPLHVVSLAPSLAIPKEEVLPLIIDFQKRRRYDALLFRGQHLRTISRNAHNPRNTMHLAALEFDSVELMQVQAVFAPPPKQLLGSSPGDIMIVVVEESVDMELEAEIKNCFPSEEEEEEGNSSNNSASHHNHNHNHNNQLLHPSQYEDNEEEEEEADTDDTDEELIFDEEPPPIRVNLSAGYVVGPSLLYPDDPSMCSVSFSARIRDYVTTENDEYMSRISAHRARMLLAIERFYWDKVLSGQITT